MGRNSATDEENVLVQALNHLEAAILLLDEGEAPAQLAAHVDLACHQLRGAIGPRPERPQKAKKAELH